MQTLALILWNISGCIGTYTLKQETFRKKSFEILRSFSKFTKVWNYEIFDLVAPAKFNSRENVQVFGRERFFSWQIFFSTKTSNYNIYNISSNKLSAEDPHRTYCRYFLMVLLIMSLRYTEQLISERPLNGCFWHNGHLPCFQ